jgi:hypothetical protein
MRLAALAATMAALSFACSAGSLIATCTPEG